jgi:hypothetical protein
VGTIVPQSGGKEEFTHNVDAVMTQKFINVGCMTFRIDLIEDAKLVLHLVESDTD